MGFCGQCHFRSARCLRRCERVQNGEHLWQVMQDEMARGRPPLIHAPAFAALPEDVRRAYIVGADAMHTMAR